MLCRMIAFVAVAAMVGLPCSRSDEPKAKVVPAAKTSQNRLAKSSSPYLLQHANNPVDWYPWGAEAFERAKKEKKLIFLSIGYSSCHWCHVMERESFSNAAIAKLMNDNFVCIKVDREERPDIDDIYMTALSVTAVQGGWPLTMILTPDGKPIFGGTYFPPEDKKVGENTIPGLKSILARVIELDKKERPELEKQADHIAKLTNEVLERNSRVLALVKLDRDLVKGVAEGFEIDPEHGGTGSKARMFKGTKFPRPPVWQFLLSQTTQNEPIAKGVTLTLRKMPEGGIYDHIGGGFHRYSTERTWTVPHFEKMLYDNAQLVELYSDAFSRNPDPLYNRVVAETLAFVNREMTSPEGAFYSALDADSEHREGEFYIWKPEEIRAVLGDADAKLVAKVYGESLNFEGKAIILRLSKPLSETASELKLTQAELLAKLTPLKQKLLTARGKRPRPFLDTKVIVAWNGQMIAGYARAGQVFKNAEYVKSASTAADFILAKMRDKDGRLFRLFSAVPGESGKGRGTAFLDDYSYFVNGLLNLHDATGDKRWLNEAKELTDLAIKFHGDGDRSGFFFAPSDGEMLFARAKDGYDGVQPSGNSQMARNLLRLAQKTGNTSYRVLCEKTMKQFALTLRMNPSTMPTMALCLNEYLAAGGAETKGGGQSDSTTKPTKSADVVKAELALGPEMDGRRKATIKLKIAEGWHIYANPVGNEQLLESQTQLTIQVNGSAAKAEVSYPRGKEHKDTSGDKYDVYEGEVALIASFAAPQKAKIVGRLKLIACKEGKCLLPSILEVK